MCVITLIFNIYIESSQSRPRVKNVMTFEKHNIYMCENLSCLVDFLCITCSDISISLSQVTIRKICNQPKRKKHLILVLGYSSFIQSFATEKFIFLISATDQYTFFFFTKNSSEIISFYKCMT